MYISFCSYSQKKDTLIEKEIIGINLNLQNDIFGNNFSKTIEVSAYQTKQYLPKRVFYKPIARNFDIKNKKQPHE